uniref:Hydroxymethylglutaryl-CoA synthase n=1 Tax=Panagrellus redivivus TaxID=6233 RepID=A0A7E4UUM2_PANRE
MATPVLPPTAIGIKAIQFYYPKNFVAQVDLEKFDGIAPGKYTAGLGQIEMGFCYDNEDVTSLALTVTHSLLEVYKIDPKSIGYLCVGTETLTDKSKSVKTSLMDLFGDNTDIEGVDVKNACFGGTQALFNAVDWVTANWQFQERLAIAVMADIAIYEPGNARCTGGAGAIAVLVGPDAPLVIERGFRSCHMANSWDFYKPIGGEASEYPKVNGSLSVKSYLEAVDKCYNLYNQKVIKQINEGRDTNAFTAILFHCPFYKIVQKAFGRLIYADHRRGGDSWLTNTDEFEPFREYSDEKTYTDRDFNTAALQVSKPYFVQKVEPNMTLNQRIGNMYTPSVYAQLVTFLAKFDPIAATPQRLLIFSYGSGLASAMFSIEISDAENSELAKMKEVASGAVHRLEDRIQHSPEAYAEVMANREKLTNSDVPVIPSSSQNGISSHLFPGTYYLTNIDVNRVRSYARIPLH